jgi:hypothetical protein
MKTKLFIIVLSLFVVISCKEEEESIIESYDFVDKIELEGEVLGDTVVHLKWTDLALGEAKYYKIYKEWSYDTSLTPSSHIEIVQAGSNEFIDNRLYSIDFLWYKVGAYNVNGEMIYSNAFVVERNDIKPIGLLNPNYLFFNRGLKELVAFVNKDEEGILKRFNF